jgi:thioredoxin 1
LIVFRCGPCKTIAPAFSKLAEEHPDVLFLKVDVDALERVAMDAGISAMPTFKYYKGSRLVGEIKGADIKKVIAEVGSTSRFLLLLLQTAFFN